MKNNPNASIHPAKIVANAIANGRRFRSSSMPSSYRRGAAAFRDIAVSPNPRPFVFSAAIYLMQALSHNQPEGAVTWITLQLRLATAKARAVGLFMRKVDESPGQTPEKVYLIIEKSREYLGKGVGVETDDSNSAADDEHIMLVDPAGHSPSPEAGRIHP
jgi:hypothetical protein